MPEDAEMAMEHVVSGFKPEVNCTWTCAEGEVLCSDGSCMPTHDEHGCPIIALLNVLKMNNFVLDKLDMIITKDMNMIEIVLNQIFAFIKIISVLYFVERRKFFAQDHTNTMKDMIMLKTMKDMDMTMEIMITKTMKDMTTTGMNTIMITTNTNMTMITKDITMIMATMVIITQDITTKLVRISVFQLL